MTSDQTISEAPNSVAISANAKGDLSFGVKAYAPTIKEALELAQEAAVEMKIFVGKEKAKG